MRVFITGASSGIGTALARQYASQGAALGLVGRRGDELARVAASCTGAASAPSIYLCDVADAAAMREAAADFMARVGTPDIVIANAGVSAGTLGAEQEDIAVLERVMKTNLVGVATSFQPFVAAMRAARRGTLVCVASVAGYRGIPGSGAYSSSKAAAIAWTEALRVELHGTGVRVVTLCPGYIDTPMTRTNTYAMPFLLSAEEFARRTVRALAGRRSHVVIPWQMGIIGWLLRRVPNWAYDRLAVRSGRKPRNLPL